MINYGTNLNGEAIVKHANQKQPSAGSKMALTDVQNQENLTYCGARTTADAIKSSGTKRLTPDCPSTSPSHSSLVNNAVNEHILNARRRFELELGRGRLNKNVDRYTNSPQSKQSCQLQRFIPHKKTNLSENSSSHIPVATSSNTTSPPPFSYNGPAAVPNLVGKYSNKMQATDSFYSKSTNEQHRTERFIRLQKFLKQSDESCQSDYVQMLVRLSPGALSRHAVELEKRAVHIAMEEGKEIQRKKVLNILA